MRCFICGKGTEIVSAGMYVACSACNKSWQIDDFEREVRNVKYRKKGKSISCYTCTHLQVCRFFIEPQTHMTTNVNSFLRELFKTTAVWCTYFVFDEEGGEK